MRQEKLNEINSYIEELKTKRQELLDTNSIFLKTKRYRSYFLNNVFDSFSFGLGNFPMYLYPLKHQLHHNSIPDSYFSS